MTAQEQNAELVELLEVYFVGNDNPAYAWGQACAGILALPALRAFWPMSSVDYTTASRARDIAGGGYHLSDNNTVTFGGDQLAPYAEFDGVNQYLSRADGGAANWADITGTETYVTAAQRGLTLGGWFKFDLLATTEYIMSKLLVPNQFSYRILKNGTNNISFGISTAGNVLSTTVTSTSAVDNTSWWYIVGRFVPGSSADIFVSGTQTSQATADAALFDSTAPFTIGAQGTPNLWLDGKASLCWLCAAALSDSLIGTVYQQTRRLFQRT